MGVPTYYSRLLDSNQLTKLLVKNIRLFISGSAPLTKETNDRFFNFALAKIVYFLSWKYVES